MRVQKRNPWLFSLGVVLAAMVLWGSQAGADVTSDRPGSVVIWPKVICGWNARHSHHADQHQQLDRCLRIAST